MTVVGIYGLLRDRATVMQVEPAQTESPEVRNARHRAMANSMKQNASSGSRRFEGNVRRPRRIAPAAAAWMGC